MTTPITKEQLQRIIESADDVLSALAGTNDDIHPDNSKKMCGLWDDLNDRYAPPEVVRELARIALAAMDAEPVADVVAWHKEGEERTCDIRWRRFDVAPGPLFAVAQPVALVPDDGREQFESWMLKKWGRERREYDFVIGKFLHGENYADSYTRHMWTTWKAARAAMLNGDKS